MAGDHSRGGGDRVAAGTSKQSSGNTNGSFGGWLQRVRRTGEYSDVLVRFGDSAEFNLHLLPLKNASSFFRELHNQDQEEEEEQGGESHHQVERGEGEILDSSRKSARKKIQREREVVELDLLGGAAAFSTAADFCYLIKPAFTFSNVARVRSVAAELGMPDLLDSAKRFLYTSVFSHWRSCAGFLQHYSRFGDSPVDDYIESRCLKVLASALTKAFADTKHVSVPLPRNLSSKSAGRGFLEGGSKCPAAASGGAAASSGSSTLGSSGSPSTAPPKAAAAATAATTTTTTWHCSSSPCSSLTEVLVTMASRLPDLYMAPLVATLVEADVNLSLKCRQGRNVRAWLSHVLRDECGSLSPPSSSSSGHRARCWIVIALAEMLLRRSSSLELSSQYWCSLLEHVEELLALERERPFWNAGVGDRSKHVGVEIAQLGSQIWPRLRGIHSQLEQRIGASLHELDDYLHSYRFSAPTLLSLVTHFVENRCDGGSKESLEQLEEVAAEVDGCLWIFAEETPPAITPKHFVEIFSAFPAQSRASHDSLYSSIDRMLSKAMADHREDAAEEIQALWRLVDCDKLSPAVHDRALNNPSFLCQPHVLERVLRIHSEELAAGNHGGDRQDLKNIMHKVIKASLKLLEENSRRSKEILQLQNQYSALLHLGKSNPGTTKLRPPSSLDPRSSSSAPREFDHDQEEVDEDLRVEDEDDLSRLPFKKKHDTEDEEDEHVVGLVQAPQTPMVEARRSLHCLTVGEILAS
ncbi:hypothetical protein SELMODRAFT_415939 [Selaginella moellendorffii]|uniref:NPH3 domain-containing protein n=1 Tax=Selaginella moellendorffii TaxID=88036 RepID=D8RXL0_SELML|nr:uncharacterized protein LOC9645601 [Selaginella moellendorffii]EFJ22755.1 hypothetical protein SELMODRAFT_415939 [Selaginella moellendorffii]|eukprot:XP_002975850.1 uncharacterized protein LOC9645601 [Selaginella moellendorffii]